MKIEVNRAVDFKDIMRGLYGKGVDNFTDAALEALYDYFDDWSEGTGEAIELDNIVLGEVYEYFDEKDVEKDYKKCLEDVTVLKTRIDSFVVIC